MTTQLPMLTADDFAMQEGTRFELALDGGAVALTLTEVKRLGSALRDGGAFALYFDAPGSAALPQSIYRIAHPNLGALDIFIVPVGKTKDGFRYEAIFT